MLRVRGTPSKKSLKCVDVILGVLLCPGKLGGQAATPCHVGGDRGHQGKKTNTFACVSVPYLIV